jgi:hypothetical protein
MLMGIVAATAPRVRAEQATDVEPLLRLAGGYVARYERSLSAVVAQEDYQQFLMTPQMAGRVGALNRKTRAYLLVYDAGPLGWLSFRDVFEVDGRPVRARGSTRAPVRRGRS